jgi:hypothetical protein
MMMLLSRLLLVADERHFEAFANQFIEVRPMAAGVACCDPQLASKGRSKWRRRLNSPVLHCRLRA